MTEPHATPSADLLPPAQHTLVPHLQVDLAMIAFGKGGKTLASALGRQGWRVVMIERSADMYGGTCINIGCQAFPQVVGRTFRWLGIPAVRYSTCSAAISPD